ncbi:hypothetical protein J3P75_14850 [Pseudomonas sp. R1-1]|uniref:hypothetical protein n=1 Tax=Pseudomonas sp. R1-1 TaxID=1602529 RepID=UPI003DA91B6A
MERYKFLYDLSRQALNEELDRFKKLEEKAGRFLSILSITIVGYTALNNAASTKIFPVSGMLSYIFITLSVLTYIALFSACARLFRSIQLSRSPRVAIDDLTTQIIEKEDLITSYYQMAKTCQEAQQIARKQLDKKTELLLSAYKEISASAYLLSASLIIYFLILATKGA